MLSKIEGAASRTDWHGPPTGPLQQSTQKMDKDTATAVISKWLAPRVRFWVACRNGTDDESLWAPMPFCHMCDKAAFCNGECATCVKERATDPKAFAEKHCLCDTCLAPLVGTWHCDNCYGVGQTGPCRACSSEIAGSDWACYGYCSRYCAVTVQNERERRW